MNIRADCSIRRRTGERPGRRLRGVFPWRVLFALAAAAIYVAPVHASEAVVVRLYEDCRFTDTNVLIDEGVLTPLESAEVKARIATVSRDARGAVPRIVRVLKNYGIDDIDVSRQGFKGCQPETSGKYVEAVGTYCGPELQRAEVFVDRQMFASRSRPDVSFEAFLRDTVRRLREQEIFDRPVVSIQNAAGCEGGS